MSFVQEFKEFAVKGNAMDLAVGVIIGGAFGTIIDSVVNDLFMPIISAIIGAPDFSNLYIALKGGDAVAGMTLEAAREVEGAVLFAYGNFITVAINFILLALVVFLMVRGINKLKRKEEEVVEEAAPEPSETEKLLMEIRDELKKS